MTVRKRVLSFAILVFGFLSFVSQAKPVHAAITLVATSSATASSGDTITTPAINTTGASLIVVVGSTNSGTSTISDNKGDTWHVLNTYTGGGDDIQLFYAYAPSTSSTQTFTITGTGSAQYPSLVVSAWSGTLTTAAVFDAQNGSSTTSGVTSFNTGSIAPTSTGELLIGGLGMGPCTSPTDIALNSGFSVLGSNGVTGCQGEMVSSAYLVDSSMNAIGPQWSWSPITGPVVADIAAFESAAPSISSFSAAPSFIASSGPSTLSWNVTNASSVTITPGSFSTSTLIGSTTVTPTSTTTYTLTATNSNSTSTATTTVAVDNSTPTTPTSVVATAFSGSQINLAWTSSTDSGGSGIAGYNIFRCTGGACTPNTEIATSSGASYNDTTVSASTTYTYAVKAYNGVGTVSATSTTATATTFAANTIDVASCTESDVQTAVNDASSGYTVVIPSGACTWTSELSITTPITLTGTGTPNVGTSTFGAGTSTTEIVDDVVGSQNPMINVTGITTGQTFRLSLLDIEPESSSTQLDSPIEVGGTCTSSGCPQLRIDNITFGLNTPWVENNNGSAASWMTRTDDVIGVIDHNTVPANSQVLLGNDNFSAYLGVGQYGDNSWAQPDSFGGANALFYENNVWHTISNGGMSMIDMDISTGDITAIGGGRAVCRYNQIYIDSGGNGIGVCDLHGTEGTGRPRSGRQLEVYDNTINCATPGYCTAIDGGPTRGGTGMLFNNHANLSDGSIWFALSEYRTSSDPPPWGSCNGSGPYDQNDGVVYASGTLTSASGGGGNPITVGDTSQSWTTNQWIPTGAPYGFYDATQGFSIEIASNTSNSLTSVSEAQQTYTASVGDSYQILRSTICIDGVGRGAGTYLSGSTPSPSGWVNESLDPIYQWGDTASGASIYSPGYSSDTGKLIANRDFYPQVSGVQTSPTSPFNGTSGTGWGTLADRPTTCTANPDGGGAPGVGYFATDADNGNGILYTCDATNTWVADYQPAPYPYALTASGLPNDPTLITTSTSGGSINQFPIGQNFLAGANVTLTANASSGYFFSGWTGSVTTSTNPLTVQVNSNMTVTANFTSASSPPIISSFSVSPINITQGDDITLSWSTVNASSVSLSGDSLNLSSTTLSGSISVTPVTTGSLIYTLIATNANGTSTATTTLTVNAASSGGGGGGGGSCDCGGGYKLPASTTSSSTASSSTFVVNPTSTAAEEALLTVIEGELQTLLTQAAQEGITVQRTSFYVFTQNLSLGMRSPDVEELQHYLNTHGFPVISTPTYAGSLGYETKYFGSSTKAALEKFQAAHGIHATGYFGPITRAYVNGHE